MNPQYCSPNNQKYSYSCFSNQSLIKIAKSYNNYSDDKIKIPKNLNSSNREKFWIKLRDKMNKKTNCKTESCWLNNNIIQNMDDSILENSFRPVKPVKWNQNKNTWLSTTDINNVLSQYEQNTNFKYIGAVPIDFDKELAPGFCVINELCKLNLEKLYLKGYRKLGIVFNLDPHDQPGSHWVSMLADLNNGGIYYFDSYGKEPPTEVQELMEKIRVMGNKLITDKFININRFSNEHDVKVPFKQIGGNKVLVDLKSDLKLDTPTFVTNSNHKNLDINTHVNIQEEHENNTEKILKFNKNIKNNSNKFLLQRGFKKFFNNIRFQYEGSECGVYSIYFVSELVRGKKFLDVIKNIIDDNTINQQREFYYRPNTDNL